MLSPITLLSLAYSNVRANRLRSVLTMLGMVFGTGAVIATLSSSEGAAQYIKFEMKKLGTDTILVFADGNERSIEQQDVQLLENYSATLNTVAVVQTRLNIEMRHDSKIKSGRIMGVDSSYFENFHLDTRTGRIFDSFENKNAALTAVIGSAVKKELFGGDNAIGRFIHIYIERSALLVEVIGELQEKGGAHADLIDNAIYLPSHTVIKLPSSEGASGKFLALTLKDEDLAPIARAEIQTLLSKSFPSGVQISDAREAIERTKSLWEKQNLVGFALALVSLLTGGVGIMNIMLLSVAQRRKEIGLRKAVGARDSHILIQFLLEAVLLCFAGGACGVLLGVLFGQKVASLMGQWESHTSFYTIFMALGFSMLVGVSFGLAPAMRASKLDPYDALRS